MVALVVTIVVLLILASISIQGITRTGIFRAAEDTKLEHKRGLIATTLETKLKINQTEQIRGTDEEIIKATYEDVKNDLEQIKKAGGKDIEVGEVTSEEKNGKTEWFFEVKVDGDVYKVGLDGSDYLGKEDELSPVIQIKNATATTNTITATVTTRRNEGGKIEYYIKEKGASKFDLAGTTDQNTFKYTKLKQETTYVIEAVAINTNGKKKISNEYEIKTSLVPKIDSKEIKFASVPNTWTNKSVEVTATLTVDGQNFTLATSKNPTSGWIASNRQIFTENGTMYAALTDGNNYGAAASYEVTNIDTVKPVIKNITATTNTIKITATDEASGIYSYAISDSETMPKIFTTIDNNTKIFNKIFENLKQTIKYYVWVKDVAGNISEVASTKTETVPKLTDANATITKSPNDWTKQEVTATASTTEKNYTLQTKKDNGEWQTTNTQKFTENGTVYARLWDGTNAGEEIYKTITNIDKTAPTATNIEIKNVTPAGYDVYVYGVKDNGSGVNRVQFPTWTEAKGQDDIQPNWQGGESSKGTKQADGTTWVYHVNITEHKTEAGEYNTHIYAYDNLENGKCIGTKKITVPMVKITYDENYVKDGITNKQTVEKVYNTELGTLGTPTRTGYTFAGWFTETAGGTQISSTTKTPVTDTTYYAHWNANPLNFANQTISKTFSTSEQKANITGASNGTGSYAYTEKTEKNSAQKDTNYISINGTTITIAANTPADTYTYVIVATDNNSKVTKEATYTIKIERAKTANAGASDKTYNGANQTGVTGTNVTLSGTTSATDEGTYTANATPDSNHAWSDGSVSNKTITWKINPKSVAVTWGTTTTFTYNGQPQAPTVSATSEVTGETINVTRTTETNAGSYTSTASISSVTGGRARKENYTLTGTTKAFTINKANATMTDPTLATGLVYNTKAQNLISKAGSGAGGTIKYGLGANNTTAPTTWNTSVTGTDAGTYYVWSKVDADGNHNSVGAKYIGTVTIAKAIVTIPTSPVKQYTYNGQAQAHGYSLPTGTTIENNGTTPSAIDAGTYNIVLKLTSTANYQWSDGSVSNKTITWKINPKSVAVTWGTTTTFTYNGQPQAPTVSATSGVTGETINVTRTTETNAGSYTSTASISSVTGGRARKENYTLTGNTKAFTINKATVAIPTNLAISTAGIVTWSAARNATSYQISIDGNNWTNATSGVDYLNTIIGATGNRTVYVRAINSNANNYTTPSGKASKTVAVYTTTINSNSTNMGTVDTSSYNVISGATFTTSGNKLTIKGITSGTTKKDLKVITATNKTGYSFSKWSVASGTTTAATTITATFTANTYTVAYNGNGATGGGTANSSHTYNSAKALTTNGFTRTGYTFAGWNTQANGSGTNYSDNQSVTNLSSTQGATVTLYALWTQVSHTLTVNPNGGTYAGSTSNKTYTQKYGTTVNVADPTRTGYTFGGWALTKEENNATWIEVMYHNPTVEGFGNEAGAKSKNTLNAYSQLGQLANMKYNNQYEFMLKADEVSGYNRWIQTSNPVDTTTVTGYKAVQNSWNTSNFAGLVHCSGNTLIAWTTSTGNWWYAIGMYQGGRCPIINSSSLWTTKPVHFYVRAESNLSNIKTPITGALDANKNMYIRDEDVTLKAVWIPNTYTISYNGNGATGGSTANTTATYDQSVTIASNGFTKTGYTFAGWTTKSDGSDDGYGWTNWKGTWKYVDGQYGIANRKLQLYARWTPNKYTISYNGNGATGGSTANTTATYDQNVAIASNGYTRTGYTFAGWTTKSNGADDGYGWTNWKGTWKYVDGQYGIASGKLQLYARWTANQLNFANQTINITFSTGTQTAGITGASNGTGSYTYTEKTEKNAAGTATNYISISGTTINIASSTPVGTYTYVITAKDNNSGVTKDATYTINVARAKNASASASNKTYNGKSQTGVTGGGITWSGTTSGIDAGTYTATATPDGNHAWSDGTTGAKTITWTMNKKTVAVTWGTTTTFNYNGSEQAPNASVASGVTGETINVTRTTGRNAGSYTSTASISSVTGGRAKAGNYTLSGNTKSFTINKVAAGNPTLTAVTATYDGNAHYVTVSGGYGGTINYRTSTNNSSWGSWTTTKPSLTDVGTIYVQAYVAGDGNHNNTGATGSVTLKMNPKTVAVTWGTTTTFNYNGGAQAPTAAATSGVANETINVTRTTGTNAGSYTSTASISSVSGGRANKVNYTLSGNTKAFTINKVSARNPTLSNTTKTYNGAAQYVTVSGGYGGTIYYRTSTNNSSWGSWTTTKPSLTDVGTIYVQAYVAGDGNHNNTGATGSVTLKMNPKTVAVTWGTTTTFNYNGGAQAPTAAATSGVANETINVTRTTATNAGNYTSTASISSVSGGRANKANYTLSGNTKAFTINPSSTAIKVYYPTSATAVSSKTVYRNKCSSSSTVLSTTNTGTSNNVLASTYNGLYGSFGGYATAVNTTTRATTAIAGIATRTETTYYVVTTGSNTSSITATFNYYNGSAWTSTTKAGTRTNNYTYYCTSTTAAKTATSYSHGSIAAPSTSTGPYSTSYVGWSTGSRSMGTTSVTTANTTYYAVYRSNVTVKVVTGTAAANVTSKTIYRNAMKDGTVLSESNTGTSNLTTISGAYNYAGLATSSGTGTITAITTCAASTTNTFYTVGITKSNATITVTYKYQNGSNDTTATGTKTTTTKYYINSANQVSSTTTVSSPSFTMPKPTRTGYEMDGWNTSSTATTATYTAGQKVSIGNSTTLYAIWYQCAAKINTTYYRTVQKAIDSVATSTSTSTTVTVLKNVTENITILENKIIALNLNEKTIKGDVSNKGTLNIYGGTVDGKSAKKSNCIANIGTLTVTNGTYSGKDQGIYNYSGTTTVKGGTISGGNWGIYGDGMIIVSGGNSTGSSYAGIGTCQGTLKITGGSFTGGYNGIRVWDNNANATIEITNGTFTGKTDSGLLVKKTKATISGGTYDGKDGTDGGYFEQCNAEIKGGTFTGKNYGLKNINGTFTITGGKFRGNTEDGFFNEKGTSYINGGYFTGYKWGINSPSGKIWYHRTDAQYSDNKYVSSQGWSAVTASDLSFY